MEDINNIKPKLHVCILNWNGGAELNQCIDSLLKNVTQDFKITVIDNGSTDSSIDNISDSVKVVTLGKNHGFSKGYNLGLEKCLQDDDEYIILLNYDTIVSTDFISHIVDKISGKGINYIYGVKILYENNRNLIWYAGGMLSLSKGIISHVGLREDSQKYIHKKTTDYVTGCCLIVHKNNYQKLNGFDSRFFMYNEDVDFCLRAKKIGIDCMYLPEPVVYHKVSLASGGNYSIKKILLKSKSSYLLFRKFYSFPRASILLFIHFIRTLFNLNPRSDKI